MNFRKYYIAFLVVFFSTKGSAQNLNIIGDTVKVSAESSPTLRFMGNLGKTALSCADDNYQLQTGESELIIRVGKDKPASPCLLYVKEGEGKKLRSHQFIIIYSDSPLPIEALNKDYSTKDLLRERIAYLEECKRNPPRTATPTPVRNDPPIAVNVRAESPQQQQPAPQENRPGAANIIEIDGLTVTREQYRTRLNQLTASLEQNLYVLCKKKDPNYKGVLDNTMKLFNNNDSVTVEITDNKTNRSVGVKKIRKYLLAVAQLPYDQVRYKYGEQCFFSNLEMGADGYYHGYMIKRQSFEAIRDGMVVSHNVVDKKFTVYVKIDDIMIDGKSQKRWTVFFGNISVSETKPS